MYLEFRWPAKHFQIPNVALQKYKLVTLVRIENFCNLQNNLDVFKFLSNAINDLTYNFYQINYTCIFNNFNFL
jgi:hypothetical protein